VIFYGVSDTFMRMSLRFSALACFLVASALTFPRIASACDYPAPETHEVDPEEAAVDDEPPAKVDAVGVEIRRGKGPQGGCSQTSTSCDDIGSITIVPTPPSDNRTPSDELGYRVRLVGGVAPSGLTIPTEAVRLQSGDPPALYLHWIDGATDDQEAIDFSIALTAIDRAGNEGPESAPIRIHHTGSGSGCRVARGNDLSLALVIGAMLWLRRSMRRSA